MNLFEGQTCQASYQTGYHRILITFKDYAVLEEHKKMYLHLMQYIQSAPVETVTNILMDMRNMRGTFTPLNDWVIETLRPAVQSGLKKAAMVLSEDVFTTFSASDALTKVSMVELRLFTHLDEAIEWLNA